MSRVSHRLRRVSCVGGAAPNSLFWHTDGSSLQGAMDAPEIQGSKVAPKIQDCSKTSKQINSN